MSGCGDIGAIVNDPPLVGAVVADEAIAVSLGAGQGVAGPPGEGSTLVRSFLGGSTWLIVHNLGRYPSVTTIDSTGDQVFGDLAYLDANTARVTFAAPLSGTAYLN